MVVNVLLNTENVVPKRKLRFPGHQISWVRAIELYDFYPNVTTLRSNLCCRNSVCLSSVVYLSVTLVHPTQGVELSLIHI